MRAYMLAVSPEVCQGQRYDFKSDVWALGCILYEICALQQAWNGSNLLGLVYKIVQEKQDPLPDFYSQACPRPRARAHPRHIAHAHARVHTRITSHACTPQRARARHAAHVHATPQELRHLVNNMLSNEPRY